MTTVLLSVFSFLGYYLTNNRPFKYKWEIPLDKKIKIIPFFVLPYILLLPYVLLAFLLLQGQVRNDFALTIIIANVSATIFWYAFPNGVVREVLQSDDLVSRIINFIYKNDGDTNGFPSGHVFLSLIASYYFAIQYPKMAGVFLLSGLLISLSTIFTKQHYVIDLAGGVLFAGLALAITNLF